MVSRPHITTQKHPEHPHTVCQTTLKLILNFFITTKLIKPNKHQGVSLYIVHTGEKPNTKLNSILVHVDLLESGKLYCHAHAMVM